MTNKTRLDGEAFNTRKMRIRTTLGAVLAGTFALIFVILVFQSSIHYYSRIALPGEDPSGGTSGQTDWSRLGALISLATFALIVGEMVFSFIDYVQNASRRQREEAQASFGIYMEMYNRLMDPAAMEARRWVIANLPTLDEMENNQKAWLKCINSKLNEIPPGWKGKRPPGREYLKDILNTFDFVGFVGKHYWTMENELVLWMSAPVVKVWERIYLYVEQEAKQRNEPDYYESAREFAEYCTQWRQENRPKSTVIKDGT